MPLELSTADRDVPTILLNDNARWVELVTVNNPYFIFQSAQKQKPRALWIGCADSRVPEFVLTASQPGEMFVHRNIANQYHGDDENVLSVVTYAVQALEVRHIVIVGHSLCGGVEASWNAARKEASTCSPPDNCYLCKDKEAEPKSPGPTLENWLKPMTALARDRWPITLERLTEENVKMQVRTAAASEPIKSAWANGINVQVHGWVYDLATGRLRDLNCSLGLQ